LREQANKFVTTDCYFGASLSNEFVPFRQDSI